MKKLIIVLMANTTNCMVMLSVKQAAKDEQRHPKQKHKNTNVLENISIIKAIKAIMSHIWQAVNVKSILKYFEFKYYFAKIAFFLM